MHDEGIEVVPRGAGTGAFQGAHSTPEWRDCRHRRMNRILSIDEQNRLAKVQPGVVNARLTGKRQHPTGYTTPLIQHHSPHAHWVAT